MTEAEWLACANPELMLTFACGNASERKCLLFGVACSQRGWEHISEGERRYAELAEGYADGFITIEDLRLADAEHIVGENSFRSDDVPTAVNGVVHNTALDIAYAQATDHFKTIGKSIDPSSERDLDELDSAASVEFGRERIEQCLLVREIFGNPFRPITFDPVWRTSDVMLLAQGIYYERAFDRMPILADALQDAGCDSEDILNHLRDPHATHVRGCWALDLVLGKE